MCDVILCCALRDEEGCVFSQLATRVDARRVLPRGGGVTGRSVLMYLFCVWPCT